MSRYSETGEVALNTNSSNATTTPLDILSGATRIAAYVIGNAGAFTTCVVTLEVSPDEGANWVATTATITGEGHIDSHICLATQARLKVTTAQGATSTVKTFLSAA